MLDALQNVINASQSSAQRPNDAALKKAAQQFEAILLQQLTASLNTKNDDDEDALFGGDAGTGLAKQMFSEQLATSMSQSGGVGLSDLLVRQFGGTPDKKPFRIKGLNEANSAVRELRAPQSSTDAAKKAPFINKSAKVEPIERDYGSGEVEVVSTFVDEVRRDGIDDSLKGLMLDGRILNSTRPRIVPNAPVTRVAATSSTVDSGATFPADAAITRPTPAARVSYRMPAFGRISSDFGSRFHPIDKRVKFHGGIDIAVPVGTKVVAAAEGIVKFAGWKGGYGNVVVIEHPDGSETLYGHNSKLLVAEGQKVGAGEQISLSGSTGKSTGPHLHFEIRRDGNLVNPADFLSNVLTQPAER